MEAIENIFKVGDRVYLYPLGWGDIQYKSDYDYSIYFEGIEDTRYIGGDVRRLISFTEYTIEGFSHDRPEELPKQGDIVWARNSDDQDWCIYHFNKKTQDGFYAVSADNSDNAFLLLQITTTNPYVNEQ
jgi:hypothetical protein